MLNCKQTSHLLSEAQDRPLKLVEQLPLRLHLLTCEGCRNYRKQLDFLRQASRDYKTQSDSDPQP